MKNLKNRIAIVLDRSSSMAPIRKETVEMFNQQVKAIKAGQEEMDTRVSLFTFSSIADEPTFWNQPTSELREYTEGDYVPSGWTALYDSVGMAIDRLSALKEASDPDCSFLVVIITDGDENRSQKHTGFSLANVIKALQSTGKWTFTFLGANVDVEKMATQLNLHKGNVQSWVTSSMGATFASHTHASSVSNYMNARSHGIGAVADFFSQDPKKKKEEQSKP